MVLEKGKQKNLAKYRNIIVINVLRGFQIMVDKMREVLVYDIEADGLDVNKIKLKYFGCYSYIDKKYYLISYTQKAAIQRLLDRHRVIVGFNNKAYDNKVLEKNGYTIGKYKIIIDLWELSAPRGSRGKGEYNKNKLTEMGFSHIKNYKLKTIIETLKLDKFGKGEIDYSIFKKDKWNNKEIKEIEKYTKKDVIITQKLFEWFESQYDPLKKFLSEKGQRNFKHLNSSAASLGYQIICHQTGMPVEYDDESKRKHFYGAHEILNRKKKYKGNLICIDFSSMYPHCITMGNLFSIKENGWNGGGYFKLKGFVEDKQQGKIETVLRDLLQERLKAKKAKDNIKSKSYKIIINAIYGLSGSPLFKSMYNEFTPGNTTSMGRTIIKRLAKTLEEYGFEIIYGFTDSVYCKIPKESNEEELIYVANKFIEEVKLKVPFPADTFKLEVEKRMKFIWFNARKSYLYITKENELHYTENILNKNTPKAVMKLFEDYIKPRIIKELDVNFNIAEFITGITGLLEKDLELAAEEHKVGNTKKYKSKTSIQYQISEAYGEGTHFLIPNTAMTGIGRKKPTKREPNPIRYCTIEEFKENKLKVEDIEIKRLIQHLKPFLKEI